MKHLLFVRHGKTAGNLEGHYIGRSDQPLCETGITELNTGLSRYPPVDIVVSSPMKRCLQTAQLIYPDREMRIYDDLRECDFGAFEGKNYDELHTDPDYIRWLDSGGTLPFPGGEAHEAFCDRCVKAFAQAVEECPQQHIAFVVHGGTIMSILSAYARPRRTFYDYQVKNGGGFLTRYDGTNLWIEEEIQRL